MEDTVAWAGLHFPEDTYEAIPTFTGLLQMISSRVVYNEDAERKDLHAAKVKRNPNQSAIIASKMTTYPPIFEGSKEVSAAAATSEKRYDFAALKSFSDWSAEDGETGLYYDLETGISGRGDSMQTVISTALHGHTLAMEFCHALLLRVLNFATWFLDRITSLYKTNLIRAVGVGTKPSKAEEKQAWESVTGSLKLFFERLRKNNVKAENAHHLLDKKRCMGLFCHVAVEELRLLEEFKKFDWVRHPDIFPALVHQIYVNYVPKSLLPSYCGDTSELKRQVTAVTSTQSKHATTLNEHASRIDKLNGRAGTIEAKTNALKQKVDSLGSGIPNGGAKKKQRRKKKQESDDEGAGDAGDDE